MIATHASSAPLTNGSLRQDLATALQGPLTPSAREDPLLLLNTAWPSGTPEPEQSPKVKLALNVVEAAEALGKQVHDLPTHRIGSAPKHSDCSRSRKFPTLDH
jgi:hypothetical protein